MFTSQPFIKPKQELSDGADGWTNVEMCDALFQASNGQWYQMNDSSVTPTDIRSVLNQQAYLLFYIKQGYVIVINAYIEI